MAKVGLGCFMDRLRGASLLLVPLVVGCALAVHAQSPDSPESSAPKTPPPNAAAPDSSRPASSQAEPQASAGPSPAGQSTTPVSTIPANAPHMTRQTRLEIIRDFETQLVYARTSFPMGSKGISLKDGMTTPNGPELQQLLALWGPAIKPGDPAHISYIQIKENHIHFDINGGPVHRKKWYERIQISGAGGAEVPLSPNETQQNAHGSYLDVYFDKYVPEMTAQQLRDLLYPVLDFKAQNKEQAYLNTLPPKVKQAIQAHYVLVGMNTEMVLHAKGKPPKKVREKDGDLEYEEWIYGEPPQDVDFVRIVGDEVVRVETMKVGGQKIVRTEKEIILEKPDKDTEAKKNNEDRPANAPSLRRPGEDPANVPRPSDGVSPTSPSQPPSIPQIPSDPGPNLVVASRG
jgi:hypothetical protein